jgi:hypothetical protein
MKFNATLLVAGALLASDMASAGPADYVYLPAVSAGEREIDFKMGSARKTATDPEAAASLGFGYGVNDVWFTELYAKYKQANGQPTAYDAVEWENKFQLTETGKYPVDVGLLVELERPKDRSEGYEMKFGLLGQTEFGKLQLNGNLLVEHHYRSVGGDPQELGYQWQAKYRWKKELEFGLQGMGEVGRWDKWDDAASQNHRVGPAIFGKFGLGGRQAVSYNAALLIGASKAAPDRTLRMQVEFEF